MKRYKVVPSLTTKSRVQVTISVDPDVAENDPRRYPGTASAGTRLPQITTRWFIRAAIVILLGYVFFDRAFAWIHVPGVPLFAGEVLLFLAILYLVSHQRETVSLLRNTPILQIAGLLFVWGLVRLAFDVPVWGIDALRDSAQTNYILIGLAVAGVVASSDASARRNGKIRTAVPLLIVVWAPIAITISRLYSDSAPFIPGSATSVLSFKPGDYELFAAAVVAYVWANGDRYSPRSKHIITAFGLVGVLVGSTLNRGGMLGAIAILVIASLFFAQETRRRYFAVLFSIVAGLILTLAVSGIAVSLGSRELSLNQLIMNVASITGESEVGSLQGTVNWRIENWQAILEGTASGDEWLMGLGYGPNIADEYGFQAVPRPSQPLRNAHNSHLTLVARLGLIGTAIWFVFLLQLALSVNSHARRRAQPTEGWIVAVLIGTCIAAIFDPVLEGPQIAIPFWVLVGALGGLRYRRTLKRSQLATSRLEPGQLAVGG